MAVAAMLGIALVAAFVRASGEWSARPHQAAVAWGPYTAFKRCQLRFFSGSAAALAECTAKAKRLVDEPGTEAFDDFVQSGAAKKVVKASPASSIISVGYHCTPDDTDLAGIESSTNAVTDSPTETRTPSNHKGHFSFELFCHGWVFQCY